MTENYRISRLIPQFVNRDSIETLQALYKWSSDCLSIWLTWDQHLRSLARITYSILKHLIMVVVLGCRDWLIGMISYTHRCIISLHSVIRSYNFSDNLRSSWTGTPPRHSKHCINWDQIGWVFDWLETESSWLIGWWLILVVCLFCGIGLELVSNYCCTVLNWYWVGVELVLNWGWVRIVLV